MAGVSCSCTGSGGACGEEESDEEESGLGVVLGVGCHVCQRGFASFGFASNIFFAKKRNRKKKKKKNS